MIRRRISDALRAILVILLLASAIAKASWLLEGSRVHGSFVVATLGELVLAGSLAVRRASRAGLLLTMGVFLGAGLAGVLRAYSQGPAFLSTPCHCLGVLDIRHSVALLLAGAIVFLATLSLALRRGVEAPS